jgi:Domain of unknown function (DUF4838)
MIKRRNHMVDRMWMILILAVAACVTLLRGASAGEPAEMTLIEATGEPPDIFIDVRATPAEKFAARELREYLQKLTGRTIKFRTDYFIKDPPAGKHIVVGHGRFATDIDTSGVGTEQYVVDVTDKRLAIVGGRDRQRGVLYGVYDLVEQLGVRWYRPEPWGEHVPKLDAIRLPLGRKVKPAPEYVYRSVLAGGFTRNAEYTLDQSEWGSLWALRNRMNGPDPGSDPRGGGQVSLQFDHIYYQLMPVEEYFDEHPEYFCLYKGERRKINPDATPRPDNPTGLQLCLSNADVQKIFAEKIIGRARGRTDLNSVSFSVTPNDACPFCECDACRAMDDPQDPTSMSNRVCAFTNIVARRVAAAVPGARLSLNAYSTWTSPPTIVKRIEPNVLIHLALINQWADYTKKFDDPDPNWNRAARDSMRRWKELGASEIYTYEYWGGYGWPGPLPVARTMADRIRQYRAYNIRGIYNETAPSWGPQGLELFLFTKLIWNPELDVDKELDLYYRNYYGPAAAPMKRYHEMLFEALARSSQPVFSGGRGMHLVLTPKLVQELKTHLDEAQHRVNGHALYERRLKGVVAGHAFAAKVADILRIKKQEGTNAPLAAGNTSYLKSARAERAYAELLSLVRAHSGEDAVFDVRANPTQLYYVEDDILRNDAFGYRNEADLLTEF